MKLFDIFTSNHNNYSIFTQLLMSKLSTINRYNQEVKFILLRLTHLMSAYFAVIISIEENNTYFMLPNLR